MQQFEVKDGILYIDEVSTLDLAKEYGTPLYVYSGSTIGRKILELRTDFLDKYPNTKVAYAAKAFLTVAVANIIDKAGLSLSVVSGGELFTAIRAGFPGARILFHGNNKSEQELSEALDYGVGTIVIDSPDEIGMLEQLCEAKDKQVDVLFRIAPEVGVDTKHRISTGGKDSKFGFPIAEKTLFPYFIQAIGSPRLNLKGIHFDIGSQIFDNRGHLTALNVALKIYKNVATKLGYTLTTLDIGGGFGIRYTKADTPKPFSYFLNPVMDELERFCKKAGIEQPAVTIEPGRSIVGDAGVTLYTVGSVKNIEGVRKYVAVDGGMSDNIRPALYGALYEAVIANKADQPTSEVVTVCGKLFDSGDLLIANARLPHAERGDILVVFSTGAYGYSFASNYNKNPIPAVVLIDEGKPKLIVRRQTYEDLVRDELPLDRD
jgi:diaminopimelate decarboxylase